MRSASLLSGSLIYLVASVTTAALPFLLLPVLTSYMPPAEFGLLGVFQGLYTLFLALCGLSTAGAVVRQSYDVGREEIGVYIFNVLLILAATTTTLGLGLLLAGAPLGDWLQIPPGFMLAGLAAAAMVFTLNLLLGQYQVRRKPLAYGAFQIGHSALNIGLSLLFVVGLGWGAWGRVSGVMWAALAFGLLALVVLRLGGRLRARWSPQDIRGALRFGVPLMPHEMGTFFVTWFGVFVLNRMVSSEAVGLYLFAFQISMVLGVICDAFNKAYVPWLFELLKTGGAEGQRRIVKLTYGYFALMAVLTLIAFALARPVVALVFDPAYLPAAGLIGWLVLGQALGGCYLMTTNYLAYARRTELLSLVTVAGSVTNVALLLALIPILGIHGGVIAFVVARLVIFLLTWVLAQRVMPMPWRLKSKEV
ncbi:lipopolysaccharide biosynthesis protein [Brevirhabdus pacifica]|nr:oligosaccharide flippase family protein [Brevirhabdus pacifica]